MGGLVDARLEGTVCVLTLRRGEKLNALSAELEQELSAGPGAARKPATAAQSC